MWANGGYATKHAFGVYSTDAAGRRRSATPHPQDEIDALPEPRARRPARTPPVRRRSRRYTVMHGRDGSPEQAIATCLLDDGRRAWGLSTEPGVMEPLTEGEWVGHRAHAVGIGRTAPLSVLAVLW